MTFTHELARRMAGLRSGACAAVIAAAACADHTLPISAPVTAFEPTAPADAMTPAVLVGAGNVARCDRTNDEATARLLDQIAGTVFTTGDNVYASGSAADFSNCYGPSWGRHRARTRPASGDLDYQTAGAAGYFGYFGAAAGPAGQGYYSYNVGDWHVVVLNSNLAMSAGSAQERWLRTDLATPRRCTLAYWHHPRFSSYSTSVRDDVQPLWDALYTAGAELVLNGHYRLYERFAPQAPDGRADPAYGIRQITVGTGGISTNSVGTAIPNSEVRRTGIFGVLKLTLSTDAYAWQFVPVAGQFFTESGSGVCHGAAHAPVAAVHVSPSTDSVIAGTTVQLSATASDASGFTLNHAPMTWRSTDTVKAKVAAGLVTGLAAGTVYVIATSGDKSDTASVTITAAPVASVVVTPAAASVGVGGTVALTATTLDHAGAALSGRLVIWSTSAPGVASVSGEGVVTGVAAGSAAVTATSEGQSASAVVTVTAPVAAARAGWHVAPGGASGNDGSSGRPWSLAYALAGAAGRIQPGDTVWLRDGIYAGLFRTALAGAPGRPIVFRQHPGERATIDGNLRVDGPDVVFWGFEIMQSNPLAYVATKVPGLLAFGARTKFINLVIHDASQQGITFWDGADDAEVYGCVVYNNGTHENLDHGIYVHHSSPATKVVADNVFFNNLAYGIHVYAGPNDATQRNVQLIGNVAFNNGSISAQWPERVNLLIGAEVPGEGMRVLDNMLYFSGSVGRNMWIGYTAANRDVEVRGNTVWGGATALQVGQWSSATIRDNRVGGTSDVVNLTHASVSGQSWSGNEYYRTPIALAWRYAGTAQPFTDWQQTTGLGLADAALPQPPAAPQAFVRPNKYEAGRALVVVYNWSRWAGVAVDLSGVLAPGERYEIRNVQALFGPPAASGTYAGGTVLIPMSGVAPPPRLGRETRTPPVTGPHFDAFIVTRVTS